MPRPSAVERDQPVTACQAVVREDFEPALVRCAGQADRCQLPSTGPRVFCKERRAVFVGQVRGDDFSMPLAEERCRPADGQGRVEIAAGRPKPPYPMAGELSAKA
jgi:hypothetical protein